MPIDLREPFNIREKRNPRTFGARIRELRKDLSMTQREVAESVAKGLRRSKVPGRFTHTYLSKIEKDQVPPLSNSTIIQLAAVFFENDPDRLLIWAGKPPVHLVEKLTQKPAARAFFNFAIDRLTEEEWQDLLALLKKKSQFDGTKLS